jgi:drug/metabolite transporter (DMT)-like permease
MTEGILLAFAAALVYGLLGITFEVAAKRGYPVWEVMFWKQLAGFAIGAALVLTRTGTNLWDPALFRLGLLAAVSYVLTLAAYLTASRERDIAANWTVLNLSVVLPILVSVAWFGDSFHWTKGIGVAVTLASIVVIGGFSLKGAAPVSRWRWLIGAAFFFNAWLPILFRFVPAGREALFTVYFYGLSVPLIAAVNASRNGRWRPGTAMLTVSGGSAAAHWTGIMLTMFALQRVARESAQAGVAVYPITNGLVIPVGVVMGALFLGQRINRRSATGVALGMGGLVFLSLP